MFDITMVLNGQNETIAYKSFDFSGGEIQVRLLNSITSEYITITAHLRSAHDLIELMLVTDALWQATTEMESYPKFKLICPYLPYARQDRVCSPGEAFSLSWICEMFNRLGFFSIIVWDVHSDVALKHLDRAINIEAADLIPSSVVTENTILVTPDKGAIHRVGLCAEKFKLPTIIAEKIRNPDTGEITHTEVHCGDQIITNQDLLIIDDICDGGRTFIELAKVLRPLTTGRIKLWVTHGIFSKGFEVFEGLIDEIYTANCFPTADVPSFVHVGHNDY